MRLFYHPKKKHVLFLALEKIPFDKKKSHFPMGYNRIPFNKLVILVAYRLSRHACLHIRCVCIALEASQNKYNGITLFRMKT